MFVTWQCQGCKQGEFGEATHGVQSCTVFPMRALDVMLQQLGVQALDLGRAGEVVRGA